MMLTNFKKWLMKIQNDFLENKLFQPTGLQISCSNIIFETKDDYSLKNLENSVDEEDYPIAYYRPDDKSIHVFIEHKMFERRKTDFEKGKINLWNKKVEVHFYEITEMEFTKKN